MSIRVDYSDDIGRFVIHSPYWALGIMRSIPNRKFEKKLNNAWTCPPLRMNVEYLQKSMPTATEFTPAAKSKMASVLEPTDDTGIPFPRNYVFKTQPYDHQMRAISASFGRKAFALFMDMRTGKTKVVIDKSIAYWRLGLVDRVLIIPLRTLRKNWVTEFSVHAHESDYETHLLDTGKLDVFKRWVNHKSGKLKVLLVGIESLSAGRAIEACEWYLRGSDKTYTVVDESDTIKNHKSIRTENMFKLRDESTFREIMTGTPISEGPMDFFSQFEFLDPNIFGIGDFYSFRNRYAIMGGYEDKEIVGYQNMDELTELAKPYVYQVRYSDVFNSPPAVGETRTVALSPEQLAIYKRIKRDNTIRRSDGSIALVTQNILEKMLRLQEVCGGFWSERIDTGKFKTDKFGDLKKPIYRYESHKIDGANPKLDALVEIFTGAYRRDQGIIWSIYMPEIDLIAAELSKYGTVGILRGDVSEADRDKLDKDFKAGRVQWIVANPTTGGRGYTFDAAMVMANYSYSHNFIHRQQSLERATSSKKTKPVMIIDIITENTVEEDVITALGDKKDVSDYVRDRLARSVDDLPF